MISGLDIEPLIGHRTQNFELTRCLVGRGLGYALLFQNPPIEQTYEGHSVITRPITEKVPPSRVVMAFPRGAQLTARARRFIEYAIQAERSSTRPAELVAS